MGDAKRIIVKPIAASDAKRIIQSLHYSGKTTVGSQLLGSLNDLDISGIDWIIYGGESGPGYRPEDKAWAREMEIKCAATGTAFFHKQSAAYRTEIGIELDGRIVRNFPIPRPV